METDPVHGQGVREARFPFVFISGSHIVHQAEFPLVRLVEERRKEVVLDADAVHALAELEDVVLHLGIQAACRKVREHVLGLRVELEGMVPRAVAEGPHRPEPAAQPLGRPQSDPGLEALFRAVAEEVLNPADPEVFHFIIPCRKGVCEGIHVAVGTGGLHPVHHFIDPLFLARQAFRADFLPLLLVAVPGFRQDDDLFAGFLPAGRHLVDRIPVVPLAQDAQGKDRGGVLRRDGEVGLQAVVPVEPDPGRVRPVLHRDGEGADPIDVRALMQHSPEGAQGVIRRVDVHLAVEYGRRNELFGMETEMVGLAVVHREAVDEVVIVEDRSPGHHRGGNLQAEGVDIALVEVGFQVHGARELEQGRLRIEAGDAAGRDDLPVERRLPDVVAPAVRLGKQGGQAALILFVDIVQDKTQVLAYEPVVQIVRRVGQVEPVLSVYVAAVSRPRFGIMPFPVLVDFPEEPPHVPVVRFHAGGLQFARGHAQLESED